MKSMNKDNYSLSREDVVHDSTSNVLGLSSTFKVDELINHIREIAYGKFNDENLCIFDATGYACKILQVNNIGNAGWQTGKIRISIEFLTEGKEEETRENIIASDAESSPLDEIRQFNS
jgi:KGK domain